MLTAGKTPQTSCSLSDQAKLRKRESGWVPDDWIIVALGSLESMVLDR